VSLPIGQKRMINIVLKKENVLTGEWQEIIVNSVIQDAGEMKQALGAAVTLHYQSAAAQ
jgi:hypothetical protein